MTETKPKRQAFSINIPDEKKEQVARIAREANRPISWLVLDMFDRMIAANSIDIYGGIPSVPQTQPTTTDEPLLGKLAEIEDRLEAIEQQTTKPPDISPALAGVWDRLSQLETVVKELGNNSPKPSAIADCWPDGSPPPATPKAKTSATTAPSLTDEDLKMVKRFEANPALKVAAEAAIEQGGSSAEISQRLLEAGFGTTNGTPHNTSVITRMRKALAHMDGECG